MGWRRHGDRTGVKIEGPCLIGKNGRIASGSHIGPYTIIGDNARIAKHTVLKHSTLWNNVQLGEHVHLEGCIVGHSVQVARNTSVHDGVLMGSASFSH